MAPSKRYRCRLSDTPGFVITKITRPMKKSTLVLCMLFCCIAVGANAAENYGPVQQNETLYRIALKYRQKGVTVSQIMMSIYRNNPDAFFKNNINRLRVGSVLEIPDLDAIGAIGRKQAYSEASSQIDAFEKEVRAIKVQRGELAPLSQAPRDPDLATGVEFVAEVTEPDAEQIAEIRQGLAVDQLQTAQLQLPEPKPAKRKKRKKSRDPLFRYSYDISIVDDDNLRLAQNDEDIRSDLIFSPTIKAKGGRNLDSFTIWNYGGSVTYNLFETFEELDNFEFEVNTRYRFTLSSGFTSPIFSLGAKIGGIEFESEMRDSTVLSLSAELNKWITNTINMTAGLGFKERQSVSEVYDTSEVRIFVNFDTEISKADLVYTTLALISGDTVSSATPTLDIINASDAIEPDDAFGGIAANQFAYRIEADTVVVTLGYNRILTRKLSIDLSARLVDSEAKDDDGIGYDRTIVRASLLGRF